MNLSANPSSRRRWLTRTGLGALSLSPLMSAVQAAIQREAKGQTPPLRFVFCVKSNGLWPELIQPESMAQQLPFQYETETVPGKNGKGERLDIIKDSWQGSRRSPFAAANQPHAGKLNPTMAPLAAHAKRVSVLQGLDTGYRLLSGSHKGEYQTLSGMQSQGREAPGPTLDAVLARAFPAPVPLLCLGHDSKSASGMSYLPISASDRHKPNAFYTKPSRAYADLFGVIDQGAAKDQYDVQSSILDFHAQDVKRLQAQIAGADREQLDRYLNAFDSLRHSRREIEAMADRLRQHTPGAPGELDIANPIRINAAHTEIAAASLISGLTNVVTLCLDRLGSTTYPGAGPLHSSVGHGQGGNVPGKRRLITGSHFEHIARLATRLQAIPEGDGTLLDHTVILYLADNGRDHHSGETNFPLVQIGNLGGRLTQGRYYAPGNDPKNPNNAVRTGDLWSTLLAAAGQPHRTFGRPKNGVAYQPVESLLNI